MLRTSLAAFTIGAIVFAASGCGGSSKTGTMTTAVTNTVTNTTATVATLPTTTAVKLATGRRLARNAWIADGDAICARANKKVSANHVRHTADYGRILPQISIYYETESTELSKLVPPASMTGDWTQIVNNLQILGAYLGRVGQYVQENNLNAARPLFHTALNIQQQLIAIAKHDGFKRCTAPT
ncbi:MAG: hypothetical protein WA484_13390 [Solirubrobacteraceae bacterium]